MSDKRDVFPEHLGDISTETLLQNLTNINTLFSRIDQIREAILGGFSVTAEVKIEYTETEEEQQAANERARIDLENAKDLIHALTHRPGRLIRLVLEPKQPSEGLL